MSSRDEALIADAREALAVMPDLLRTAYEAVLAPAGARNEAGVRQPGVRHPMPLPSDPAGWATYRWACDELVRIMQLLVRDFRLPSHVRDSWPPVPGRAALIVRAVSVYLTDPKPGTVTRACGRIIRVDSHLRHVAGAARRPPPPTCETAGCTDLQQDGRRCHRCRYIKRTTGDWPAISRSVG